MAYCTVIDIYLQITFHIN